MRSLSSPQGRIAQAGDRKCGSSWEPAGGGGAPVGEPYQPCWSQNWLLTHSNPLSFMFMHTCSSTFKLSELHVHTRLFFPLYPRHPGSGEPLGSAYAFPNLRQNRDLSSEASQYPLAAISKPTVFWSLAFPLLRPYKEHVNSSVGAKNSRLGTHPRLTACGAHFQVRLP